MIAAATAGPRSTARLSTMVDTLFAAVSCAVVAAKAGSAARYTGRVRLIVTDTSAAPMRINGSPEFATNSRTVSAMAADWTQ